uniref:HMG box domain-containing protein n=1 Tax=Vannella robusta TaxID=1487602 RepID=A0A7S4M5D0_9EUKA|mmetsp:Transcript_11580/g.14376  ORF Transcript_11580/g.14376 Transcript_11580/m.14376 type:complete len:162 (+) Transcript_11580:180-665(+)
MIEPVNCFLLFCQEERKTISLHCKAWDNSQVTSHLGELWREMDPKLKLQYKMRAARAKKNFAANNPNFKRKTKVESSYISSFRLTGPTKKISKPATVKLQRPLQYFDIPAVHHTPRNTYSRPVQSRSMAAFPFETLQYYSDYYNPYPIYPMTYSTNHLYYK